MKFISPSLRNALDRSKNNIEKCSNWMYYVKDQFEYEKISRFDSKKRSSRAFYKLFEILRKYDIVPVPESKVLCLCEAPGGFMEAFGCLDSSLDIYGISLPGGIKFSDNVSGYEYLDISRFDNIIRISKKSKELGKYDIITADGGIDVSDDYDKQEVKSLRIIFSQILAMLYSLKNGGTFIIKIFDCFEEETVKLLQLLYDHFQHFDIFKPLLSRPCNSEKYVICQGFKGYNSIIKDFVNQCYNNTIRFNNISISTEFHNKIINFNTQFIKKQIRNIDEIIDICNGKFNSRNINLKHNQLIKSQNMFNILKIPK